MRQLLSCLTVCLAAATTAVTAEDATIFMSGTTLLQNKKHISPETARLLLSRRLGWSGSSLMGDVDGETLEDLNTFGGQQPFLFEDSERKGRSHKLLVIAQGFDPAQDAHMQAKHSGRVTVKGPGSDFVETSFVSGLLSEASPQRPDSRLCSYQRQLDPTTIVDILFRNTDGLDCPLDDPFAVEFTEAVLNGNVERLRSVQRIYFGTASPKPGQQVSVVLRMRPTPKQKHFHSSYEYILPTLALVESPNTETTVVLLPGNSWVTPSAFDTSSAAQPSPQLHKRHTSHLLPRDSNDNDSDNTTLPSNHTLSTLLPICYSTNETCNARTNSCSGHGFCYLKRRGVAKNSDCYACECLRTVVSRDGNGNPQKTTQWGGPACQKKDVSMPFWLLGGFSVLLVVAIWFGIGLLWQMGQEELPGVLSAGVTAPRAQK